MDGVRLLGRTSGKPNDYDLSTPTTTAGSAYECCEMNIIAFICLGCVMAVIFSIALVWFIWRKRLTEQYTLNKQTSKMSGSQTQQYTSVQQDPSVCQRQTVRTPAGNDVPNDVPLPNRTSNEHHFILIFKELSYFVVKE